MRTTQCILSSRIALHKVFVSPFEPAERAVTRRLILSTPTRNWGHSEIARASFIRSGLVLQSRGLVRRAWRANLENDTAADKKSKVAGPLRDNQIRDRHIMVVDQDNQMTGPHFTQDVLASLDQKHYTLRMVKPASTSSFDGSLRDQPAICKIIDKHVEQAALKAKKEVEKASKQTAKLKELELNWAIAAHDLEYKMKNLRTFLEKGYRVEVLLAKKNKGRTATKEEREELLRAVRETTASVSGAKEWKGPDGDIAKTIKLYLEAPAPG